LAVKNSAFELSTNNIKQAETYLLERYATCPINQLQSRLLADENYNPAHKLAISLVETASRFKNKFDKECNISRKIKPKSLKINNEIKPKLNI
jgi:hypothetical protein